MYLKTDIFFFVDSIWRKDYLHSVVDCTSKLTPERSNAMVFFWYHGYSTDRFNSLDFKTKFLVSVVLKIIKLLRLSLQYFLVNLK